MFCGVYSHLKVLFFRLNGTPFACFLFSKTYRSCGSYLFVIYTMTNKQLTQTMQVNVQRPYCFDIVFWMCIVADFVIMCNIFLAFAVMVLLLCVFEGTIGGISQWDRCGRGMDPCMQAHWRWRQAGACWITRYNQQTTAALWLWP